ncbi:TniQ family protein [Endozoicomonas sp. G2_1]|uniref:TnsD family Tn7-like transposition protein n=1 Tax=Endozoicomonas sp. G2_1 TaxID=2821091 RepID=UPI001ADA3EF0|nr:TnsD family Tn7-like transposition protein [Endozoicomonas sp. G2_1]MBO9489850.1 TniQ family protein [Endozoicomonas sp. G2_1]
MLTLLDGETIYSLLSRFFNSLNLSSAAELNLMIFGKEKKRVHFYLPSQIQLVADFFGLNSHELLHNHTLYDLYWQFLPRKRSRVLKRLMLANNERRVPSSIIESNSSLNSPYYIKYCPVCTTLDIEKLGVTYWRRIHQLPLLNTCPYHKVKLLALNGGDGGVAHQYLIPIASDKPNKNCEEKLQLKFSEIIINLLYKKNKKALNISNYYDDFLAKHNLKRSNSLNLAKLDRMYEITMHDYDSFKYALSYKQFVRILRHPLAPVHPVKHLLTLTILDLSASEIENTTVFPNKLCDNKNKSIQSVDSKSITSFYRKCGSINQTSKNFHVSRLKTKKILKVEGVIPLTPLERTVCLKALLGQHRKVIANEMGLSIGYIEQIISFQPLLVEHRKKLKYKALEFEYKNLVITYIDKHPNGTIKDLKSQIYKEYYWLYRNQHKWLLANTYKLMPIHRSCSNTSEEIQKSIVCFILLYKPHSKKFLH